VSREDGFAVMDVSVDIVNDPKIRKLYRHAPAQAGPAIVAYLATMGESWKAGRRVSVEDAWPAFMPFDQAAVDAMIHVELLDSKGLLSSKAWRSWFMPAQTRREAVRERWRRANEKRAHSSTNDSGGTAAVTAATPRGSRADTAANHSVPIRSDSDSVPVENEEIPPPPAERGRRANGTNPRSRGEAPRDVGDNPRANGTSTRQVRADRKRGSTQGLVGVLRRAAAQPAEPASTEQPSWAGKKPAEVGT
jgi:hypothetical protein